MDRRAWRRREVLGSLGLAALGGACGAVRGQDLVPVVPPSGASPQPQGSSPPTTRGPAPAAMPSGPLLDPPAAGDDSHPALRAYQQRLLRHYGHYRAMPLDVKAEYFEWELWRYHLTDFEQAYNRVEFPERPDARPTSFPARDTSTWNGALLAALALKYAATKSRQTLDRLATLLRGMSFFFEVTGQPGLMARSIHPDRPLVVDEREPELYTRADGRKFYYFGDAAKGGFNQIAAGYAHVLMHAYADLPAEAQALARRDVQRLALHLILHDWKATARDGRPTSYGDLTPLVGSSGVPFNAQVAYLVTATGYYYPTHDANWHGRIVEEFVRLRQKHHVYYENPLRSLIQPQRVAASPLVKGMNDRNHVMNAAFAGLELERYAARGEGRDLDADFLFELGQTMLHGAEYLDGRRNALCSFMWAAELQDPRVAEAIAGPNLAPHRGIVERGLVEGIEQLRRFRLDRWVVGGFETKMPVAQWCDAFRPDDFQWKINENLVFHQTGPWTNTAYCAMDYLIAYWLLRRYRLDEHPAARAWHADALGRTPGLA